MQWKVKRRENPPHWRDWCKWFAWFPVGTYRYFYDGNRPNTAGGPDRWVWLEPVWRRTFFENGGSYTLYVRTR